MPARVKLRRIYVDYNMNIHIGCLCSGSIRSRRLGREGLVTRRHPTMTLSVGLRVPASPLQPKLRGSDSYLGGTDSHSTCRPSLDARGPLPGNFRGKRERRKTKAGLSTHSACAIRKDCFREREAPTADTFRSGLNVAVSGLANLRGTLMAQCVQQTTTIHGTVR